MPTIEDRLRLWQKELLDLTNRNALLNHRYSTTRPTSIQLDAPDATEIFATFALGKPLTIISGDLPETVEENEILEEETEQLAALAAMDENEVNSSPAPRLRNGEVRTNLPNERAGRVLLRLAARARGAELEQGINTLFMAFGLLKWSDPREPEQWRYAPLVMWPAHIEENLRNQRYRVAASDDDPEFNQTLTELLRRQFGMDIDIDIDSEDLLENVLEQVRSAVANCPGWEVLSHVYLGHFQFHKVRMFEDLAEHASIALGHEIIQALGSDMMEIAGLPEGIPAEGELDRRVPADQSFTVLDADASQLQAVQAVNHGSHLIIQGPPGTGKSQTIANIIAECIAAGRTVLFVSEKAAAIDVVHRRLAERGLGMHCLMLHSHKANKSDIIAELGQRLIDNSTSTVSSQARLTLSKLQEQRLFLDDYVEALHRPRPPLQESVFWAQSHIARLSEIPLLTGVDFVGSSLTNEELDRAGQLLHDLSMHADVLKIGDRHVWAGAYPRLHSLTERERLRQLLTSASQDALELLGHGSALAAELGVPDPVSIADFEGIGDLSGLIPATGGLRECWFDVALADRAMTLLNECQTHVQKLSMLEARLFNHYDPAIFDISLEEAIASYSQGFLGRLFSSSYKQHRAGLRSVAKDVGARDHADELATLRQALLVQQSREWLQRKDVQLQALLGLTSGAAAKLDETGWRDVASAIERAAQIARFLSPSPVPARLVLQSERQETATHLAIVRERAMAIMATYSETMAALAQFFEDGLVPVATGGSLLEISRVLSDRAERLYELDQWVRANIALLNAHTAGLTSTCQKLLESGIAPELWADAYRRMAITSWRDAIVQAEPVLRDFDRASYDRRITQFRELDKNAIRSGSHRVREAWARKRGVVSAAHGGEPGILRHEMQKRKRHMPLRKLFERIPNLLPVLKPCLMMSPLSVAQFLPADRYRFDVVIFDEASQVRPYDAIGAIMRGKQLVVAGDRKQLPPTSFFDRTIDEDASDDSQDVGALESILDALNAKGMPQTRLLWHYRSRHEDLIAYSNHHFYDGQLITFPAPGAERTPTSGVQFVHVPDGRYVDERDRILKTPDRINRIEARRVAQLVMEHARTRPQESLLVVTLGTRHREVVEEEILRARQFERDLDDVFSRDRVEPFEVKALEQVQGDERDVIIVSIGYGKNADGILSHNFGPLNAQGGERRLNVLVTRARTQIVLVSSIRYSDIDPSKTQNLGPVLLRNYLEFAEKGAIALQSTTVTQEDGDYESPFEEQVGEALARLGHEVRRQVGASKYRIDLAIIDPRDRGRFLLGIECDGKTYHQSKTARDRDRLRQEVLEQLGWQIHRVWSTEWIRNPVQELARIQKRVSELLASDPSTEQTKVAEPGLDEIGELSPESAEDLLARIVGHDEHDGAMHAAMPQIASPYVEANFAVPPTNLWETPLPQIAQAVRQCIAVEGPIHQAMLQRRLATLWGYQRAGTRIARQVEAATQIAAQRGWVRIDGEFLWPAESQQLVPRGPSLSGETRAIAHIPEQEIVLVIQAILDQAMSLTTEEMIVQTARVLGYQRVGSDIRAGILAAARGMHKKGAMQFREGRVQTR